MTRRAAAHAAASPAVAVGLGARRGTVAADLAAAVDCALAAAGLTSAEVTALGTIDRRAADPGVRELALDRGWRLAGLPAASLAGQAVPHPSAAAAAAVGTASVAEAAALRLVGPGGVLVVTKLVVRGVTVAVARGLH